MSNELTTQAAALKKLREEFPQSLISKLPKPYKKDSPKGECRECGGYHGLPAMHLDYVGHAALTHRLLDVDPLWSWEPLGIGQDGLPVLDKHGGLWIRLTVCGMTRLGYGDADGKTGPSAVKELIGDALRNAAMRFGAALDLWHKGDLHADDDTRPPAPPPPKAPPAKPTAPASDAGPGMPESQVLDWIASVESMHTRPELEETRDKAKAACVAVDDTVAYARILAAAKKRGAQLPTPKAAK